MIQHPLGAEDSRGPPKRILSECTRMSLEKWSIEEGWILGKMDGLQRAITCPQFTRVTTAFPITTIGFITDLRREQPPPGREGVVRVGRTHPVLPPGRGPRRLRGGDS